MRPLRYHTIVTPYRTTVAIVILWCYIIGQNILQIVFAVSGSIDEICTFGGTVPVFVTQALLVTAFLVPCYVKIMFTVWRLKKFEPHLTCYPQETQCQQKDKLKQRKMTKTMAYILGPFLFCFYSAVIYNAIIVHLCEPHVPFVFLLVRKVTLIIFWSQSLINPFVYCWRHQSFRKAYRKLHGELKALIFRLPGGPQSDWQLRGMIIELGKFSEKLPDSGSKGSEKTPETSDSVDENLPLRQPSGQATWKFQQV